MLRRAFLNSLFAASAALLFAGRAQEAVGSSDGNETSRELLIQESPVAGFQYHDGEGPAWPRLSLGDSLLLLRQPDNPCDRQAVAVYRGDAKLRYVPRVANTAVSQMMDRGERLVARVERLRESRNPWQRVEFSICVRIAV